MTSISPFHYKSPIIFSYLYLIRGTFYNVSFRSTPCFSCADLAHTFCIC
uniref:Uncharacterized protein n=1 Tax=Angiostrongylus cantonensis TaxID=6313 RepID=A0A0K0D5Y2_ANGCA